jgi:hypothetical protein
MITFLASRIGTAKKQAEDQLGQKKSGDGVDEKNWHCRESKSVMILLESRVAMATLMGRGKCEARLTRKRD